MTSTLQECPVHKVVIAAKRWVDDNVSMIQFLACRACRRWLSMCRVNCTQVWSLHEQKWSRSVCLWHTDVHALMTNISFCQINWEKCLRKCVYINNNIIFAPFIKLKTFFKLLILQQRRRELTYFFKCSCTAPCWTEDSLLIFTSLVTELQE